MMSTIRRITRIHVNIFVLFASVVSCRKTESKKESDVSINQTTSERTIAEEKIVQFSISKQFLPRIETHEVEANKRTTLKVGVNGTKIHIPKDAFVDVNNNPLNGRVKISFQEFKNSADMAFSKLPMTYTAVDGKDYRFNSSGMFSINGSQDGRPILLATNSALTIDYYLPKHNENIDFYRMNEDSTQWTLIQEINEIVVQEEADLSLEEPKADVAMILDSEEKTVTFRKFNGKIQKNFDPQKLAGKRDGLFVQDNGDRVNGTLLAEGTDVGHTYPKIIKGLKINGFGVYNCDQIYRLRNQVSIQANYIDENEQRISSPYSLSLIDTQYNGAFSFPARGFICNAKAKNVLALFTNDKRLYIMKGEEFLAMGIENSGKHTFKMKEVTDQIRSSEDLANYLSL